VASLESSGRQVLIGLPFSLNPLLGPKAALVARDHDELLHFVVVHEADLVTGIDMEASSKIVGQGDTSVFADGDVDSDDILLRSPIVVHLSPPQVRDVLHSNNQ
jgi:hypothetical protein